LNGKAKANLAVLREVLSPPFTLPQDQNPHPNP
jgi:hypothetical protein